MAYKLYHSPLLSAMDGRGDDGFLRGEDYVSSAGERDNHVGDYDTLRGALDAADDGHGVYLISDGETELGFARSIHAPTFSARVWWYPIDGTPVSAAEV